MAALKWFLIILATVLVFAGLRATLFASHASAENEDVVAGEVAAEDDVGGEIESTHPHQGVEPKLVAHSQDYVDYLPSRSGNVDLFDLVLKPPLKQIADKLEHFAQANPELFAKLMKANPGKPMAYDARMGISAAEFQRYIREARQGMVMQKVGSEHLNILLSPERITIDVAASVGGNVRLEINRATGKLAAGAFGNSEAPHTVSSPDSPFGNLVGYSWTASSLQGEDLSTITGTDARLTLGRVNAKECIMMFDAKKVRDGQLEKRSYFITKYDCAAR